MKQLIIEPTYKKSVLEYQVWTKEIDGKTVRAIMELGWRWGSFYINIPETEKEILDWAGAFETIDEILEFYVCETIDELKNLNIFSPPEDEDHIELDDYDFEMIECWDGCWEDWKVLVPYDSELDSNSILEEIEEGWSEDGFDYMYENDWTEDDCYFEMICNPKIYEVDKDGNAIKPDEEGEA